MEAPLINAWHAHRHVHNVNTQAQPTVLRASATTFCRQQNAKLAMSRALNALGQIPKIAAPALRITQPIYYIHHIASLPAYVLLDVQFA
jgi:hypothetical protein